MTAVALAVALLGFAPNDAGAAKYTSVNIPTIDNTHTDGTSVSASWNQTDGALARQATAFADYGVLKVTGSAILSGGRGADRVDATASWYDNLTIANSSLTGTSGTATVAISVTGSLDTVVGANLRYAEVYGTVLVRKLTSGGGFWIWRRDQAGPTATAVAPDIVTGSFSLDIPVVFGEPFDLTVSLSGTSRVADLPGNTLPATGTSRFNLGNSLYWEGITRVTDAGGNPVSYTLTSESGVNWALAAGAGAAQADFTRSFMGGGTCSAAPGGTADTLSGAIGALTLLSPVGWLWAVRRRRRAKR